MMMPFVEPKMEMAIRIDIEDPAQGPRATLVTSMATTAEVFTTAIPTNHLRKLMDLMPLLKSN